MADMRDLDNKEIGQIRYEFTDGTWFIWDNQTFKHVKYETKMELDLAISKAYHEIQEAGEKAKQQKGGLDLGIDVGEDINTQDKFGGS